MTRKHCIIFVNWEFLFPDFAIQLISPELQFPKEPHECLHALPHGFRRLFELEGTLKVIYFQCLLWPGIHSTRPGCSKLSSAWNCKVFRNAQALSHGGSLKCNQVLQSLGKKHGKGKMGAFIMKASLRHSKECISRQHAEKASGNDTSKAHRNQMIQLADPDVIFGMDCS